MMAELLPCPFCSSALIRVEYIRDGRRAHCRGCGAAGAAEFNGPQGMPNAESRAIAMWNMRTATPSAEQTVGRGIAAIHRMLDMIGEPGMTDHDLAKVFCDAELEIRAALPAPPTASER